jgi:SAM-dependent methyltransferase
MTSTPRGHATPEHPASDPGCPLCGGGELSPAHWVGRLRYEGRLFRYLVCRSCGSLHCDPMPGPALVREMYGEGYAQAASASYEVADEKQPERVLSVLDGLERGTFADFGCGSGDLLRSAYERGWKVVGIELDPGVADRLTRSLGLEVRSYEAVAGGADLGADVVHLGDVIEHLTDLDRQLRVALSLLRPGGLVIAQGPLEANANLFNYLLRGWGHLRPGRQTQLPPWHVLLATARGQRALFDRLGLTQLEFSVFEVDWPAPSRLARADLRHPRVLTLYAARRTSVVASRLAPSDWGNRYFYIGRVGS